MKRIFVLLLLTAVSLSCKPVPEGERVSVDYLPPLRVLPDGNENSSNVYYTNTTKRVRVKVTPGADISVLPSDVKVEYSFNTGVNRAFDQSSSVVATRKSGSDSAQAEYFADIPGSKDRARCDWFNYRWVIKTTKPSAPSAPKGSFVGATKTFQITGQGGVSSDPLPACEDVPN